MNQAYEVRLPQSTAAVLRFSKMMMTYFSTQAALEVDDLPLEMVEWLDVNNIKPVMLDYEYISFSTPDDALLFKMRWR
jgi:hypothetical protein